MEALGRLPANALVVDPMCGSGTVLKHAVEAGHDAVGFDMDPLAVLMSRVACRGVRSRRVQLAGERLVDAARISRKTRVPWIDADLETREFVNYWFAPQQQRQLRRLALQLHGKRGPTADILRIALSRTIITKDSGASLARDVSHSRPHRVADDNDYDVYAGFLSGLKHLGEIVDRDVPGTVRVRRRDARRLPAELDGKADLIVTSPPYLNAIDYMRGHRMSLVWLGHNIPALRAIRGASVGAERGPEQPVNRKDSVAPQVRKLTPRQQAMLDRYGQDMATFATELRRTLSPQGEAVVVVGDCTIRGGYVRNSLVVERAAARAGLDIVEKRSRRLPSGSRYLPPPTADGSALSKRMQKEVVLRLRRKGE